MPPNLSCVNTAGIYEIQQGACDTSLTAFTPSTLPTILKNPVCVFPQV